MHKSIYISIFFHLSIIFLLLSSSIGILRPDNVLTNPKDIIIRAEIINGEMEHENVSVSRQKAPAAANLKSQVVFQDPNNNSPDVTNKEYKELFPEASDYSLAYLIKKSEETRTSLKSVTINSNPYITSYKGTQANNYQTAYVTDPLRIIRDSIEKAKVYPPLARRKGIEGKVFLRFRIRPNGQVEEVRIIKSSGSEILDKTSIETIKRSAPLPYVAGWIELPLTFRLE